MFSHSQHNNIGNVEFSIIDNPESQNCFEQNKYKAMHPGIRRLSLNQVQKKNYWRTHREQQWGQKGDDMFWTACAELLI